MPEDRAVTLAVIGAGAIGRRHALLCAKEPACRLVGIADPSPAAAALAAELGVPSMPSAEALLDAIRPDGVIIAVPTPLHEFVGLAVAEMGVHILMEKPIASDPAGAQRLIEAARRAGVQLLVGHHRRHNPIVQAARRIVQGGELGKLLAVNLLWAVLKPASYFDIDWRRGPGAGPVLTNLIHEIDLLRCVCGEIDAITAVAGRAGRGFAIEDSVGAIVQFVNGAIGTITGCDAAPSPWSWDAISGENPEMFRSQENVYRLLGSEASLEFPHLKLWRYRVDGEPGWTRPLTSEDRSVAQEDAYVLQLRHFCAVVRGDVEPLVSGEDGLCSLAATAAILQSAAIGSTITVSVGT